MSTEWLAAHGPTQTTNIVLALILNVLQYRGIAFSLRGCKMFPAACCESTALVALSCCHFGLRPVVAPRSSGRLWWMRVIFCATLCKAPNAIDTLNSLFRYRLSVSIMARLRLAILSTA